MRQQFFSLEVMTARTVFKGSLPKLRAGGRLGRLLRLIDRVKQRDDLSDLDDYLLADIGLTRREAEREAGKWFWE